MKLNSTHFIMRWAIFFYNFIENTYYLFILSPPQWHVQFVQLAMFVGFHYPKTRGLNCLLGSAKINFMAHNESKTPKS